MNRRKHLIDKKLCKFLTASQADEVNTGDQGITKSRGPGKYPRCILNISNLEVSQSKRKDKLEMHFK